jgi:hypothetical protein
MLRSLWAARHRWLAAALVQQQHVRATCLELNKLVSGTRCCCCCRHLCGPRSRVCAVSPTWQAVAVDAEPSMYYERAHNRFACLERAASCLLA